MRSKCKKVLASLLAVMLLVASIPISAMAKDADYKAEVNIKLAVVTLDSNITTANLTAANATAYRNNVKKFATAKGVDIGGGATSKEEIAQQAEVINSLATVISAGDGTESNPYVVQKGQPFILAIDLDAVTTMGADGQAKYGLGTGSAFDITFDSGLVTHTNNQSKVSYILLSDEFTVSMDSPAEVLDYYPGTGTYSMSSIFKANSTTKNGQSDGEPWKDVLNIGFTNSDSSGANYIPKGATWDGYVLMTAQKAGTTEVGVLQYTVASDIPGYYQGSPYGSSVGAMMMRYDRDNEGTINTAADKIPNDTGIHYTPIWIKVESAEASIDLATASATALDPKPGQTVTVEASKGKFASPASAANFSIVDSTGEAVPSAPSITKAEASADGSTVTLTFDASDSNLVAGTQYKIKAELAAVTPDSDPAEKYVTSKSFTVKGALDGTVKIQKDNADLTAAPVYGDTLKAVYEKVANEASNLTYTWTVGTTTKTGETLVLDDPAYVGKTITVKATDSQLYGEKTSTATQAVVKKKLSYPANTNLGEVAAVPYNAGATTSVKADGKAVYKFTTGLAFPNDEVTIPFYGEYTDAQQKDKESNPVTVTAYLGTQSGDKTLGGKHAGGYELDGAAGNYTATGNIIADGYTLTAEVYDADNQTQKIDNVSISWDPSFIGTEGGTSTGTVTASLGQDESLVNWSASNGTVTEGADGKLTYTVGAMSSAHEEEIKFYAKVAQVKKIAMALDAKDYDGEYDIDVADIKLSVSGDASAQIPAAVESKIRAGITAVYTSDGTTPDANAGQNKTVKVTVTDSDINAGIADGVITYTLLTSLTGTINQITVDDVKVEGATVGSGATLDDVLAAIKGADIYVNDIEVSQGKVGEYFTDDETIIDALKEQYPECFTPDSTELADGDNITSAAKGHVYTFPADAEDIEIDSTPIEDILSGEDEATYNGLTITKNEDGSYSITVNDPVTATEITFTSGEDTATVNFGAIAELDASDGTWDFSSQAGSNLSVSLNMADADETDGDLFTNFSDAATAELDITVPVDRAFTPSTSSVTFDAGDYGTADFNSAKLDSDGKVEELPKVTTKAGVVFKGWSTKEGDINFIIDPETAVLESGTTLYAVYTGYMVGDGNGKIRPTDNVLRKELIKMLVIAAGVYDPSVDYTEDANNLFPDMAHDWSDNYIACAKLNGIVHGDADTKKFRPNDEITREEAAIMIANAFKVETTQGDTTDRVTDFDKVSDWAQKFVAALCNRGVINGYDDGEFKPATKVRRMDSATMINKFLGLDSDKQDAIKADADVKNPFTDIGADEEWAKVHLLFASLNVPGSYYADEVSIPSILSE